MYNTDIDFLVYGDGEFPFANIVGSIIENDGIPDKISAVKNTQIDGVRSLVNGQLNMGKDIDPCILYTSDAADEG